MFKPLRQSFLLAAAMFVLIPLAASAQNRVMGRLLFGAHGWINKTAGIWVDGQYVGFEKELHGSRTVYLLPGKHTIEAREAGYQPASMTVVVSPGLVYGIIVHLQRDPAAHYSTTPAVVKTDITPGRAAVFVDGMYAGHADEFEGTGKELLLSPGRHKIDITLTGYQSFTTQVSLSPSQVFKLQTRLAPGSVLSKDANLRQADARPKSE